MTESNTSVNNNEIKHNMINEAINVTIGVYCPKKLLHHVTNGGFYIKKATLTENERKIRFTLYF